MKIMRFLLLIALFGFFNDVFAADGEQTFEEAIHKFGIKQNFELIYKDNKGYERCSVIGFSETGTIFLNNDKKIKTLSELSEYILGSGSRGNIDIEDIFDLYDGKGNYSWKVVGFYFNGNVAITPTNRYGCLPIKSKSIAEISQEQVISKHEKFDLRDQVYDLNEDTASIAGFFNNGDVLVYSSYKLKRVDAKDLKLIKKSFPTATYKEEDESSSEEDDSSSS
jgi:hypothetical protein